MSVKMKVLLSVVVFAITVMVALPHSIRYWEAHLPAEPDTEYAVSF